jgi:hypothetical protein
MDVDGSGELGSTEMFVRAGAVVEFIFGHLLVQEEVDPQPERYIANWISLLTGHVGRASSIIAAGTQDQEARRTAAAWLACASADALRARLAFAHADRATQLADLEAHVLSVLALERSWRPAVQVALVVAALGELAEAAAPIMTADPDAGGPVPPFRRALARALDERYPDLAPEVAARVSAREPVDDVEETAWALDDLAQCAGAAAVVIHPGGVLGMPIGAD